MHVFNQIVKALVFLTLLFNLVPVFAQSMGKEGSYASRVRIEDPGFSYELLRDINQYRRSHNLKPLYYSKLYTELAQDHSDDMAARHMLDHRGFNKRFAIAQSYHCVENAGWNNPTPAAALTGWIHSRYHRKNLLDPNITSAGIGLKFGYVTFFACQ